MYFQIGCVTNLCISRLHNTKEYLAISCTFWPVQKKNMTVSLTILSVTRKHCVSVHIVVTIHYTMYVKLSLSEISIVNRICNTVTHDICMCRISLCFAVFNVCVLDMFTGRRLNYLHFGFRLHIFFMRGFFCTFNIHKTNSGYS